MAKQRRRTLKRKAGGLETQFLSRGKSLTKKALGLGKTIVEEFSKEQLKGQLKSALQNIGKQVLTPAKIRVPQLPVKHKSVHFSPTHTKSNEHSNIIKSPSPTTKQRNTRSFKEKHRIPETGVLVDLAEKTGVKRTLQFDE
jgi:hypothetical protein